MDLAVKFCQDLLPSLEDSVILGLRCPTCKEILQQPIFHCERGHSFCSKCYKNDKNCNWCGSNRSATRTHHLERIFDSLTFPCKHFGKGCQKRCHPTKLEQHEQECQTIKIPCPLKLGTKCTFVGTKKQVLFHCQLVHGSFTFVADKEFKQKILHIQFLEKIKSLQCISTQKMILQSFYLYYFKETLFQGLVQLESTYTRLRICRISPPSEMDDTYEFTLKLYDFDDNVLNTFQRKSCVSNGWKEPVISKDSYVQINAHTLKHCRYFTIDFKESS